MQTAVDTKSAIQSSESSNTTRPKGISASAPILPLKHEESTLQPQISAPSYFYSLRVNQAPPFKKPEREIKPTLLINTVFQDEDVVKIIEAAEVDPEKGLGRSIGQFLVQKKIIENYNLTEKSFLTSFLSETIDYAAQRDFSAYKLACLLTLYTKTHMYFKWYYWLSPVAVWYYFREILIRHTIEDSPDGQEVFTPEECYDILTHFHTMYVNNLPLIHILTFGAHRLKFVWPFKAK